MALHKSFDDKFIFKKKKLQTPPIGEMNFGRNSSELYNNFESF